MSIVEIRGPIVVTLVGETVGHVAKRIVVGVEEEKVGCRALGIIGVEGSNLSLSSTIPIVIVS